LSRAETHRLIEEHFREVSASLPYFKRVKVLHFTDIELPRTATRKVKRREVVRIMSALEENQKAGRSAAEESVDKDSMWLMGISVRFVLIRCVNRKPFAW
jgi:long-chain acyl-CoA synthetase